MKRRSDRLIIYVFGYAYAFIILLLLATIFYKSIPIWTLLLISASSYLVVNLLLSFKITRIITYSLAAIAGIATGVLFLTGHAQFIVNQWDGMMLLCSKICYNEFINTPELAFSSLLLTVASSMIVSLAVFLTFNRFFRFFLITAATLAAQISAWFITGKENKLILSVICLLTVISYFRHVYEKKIKTGLMTDHKVPGSIMLFSIPAAIIPIIIIMLMPKNDLPIQWPWLDQKIMSAIKYLEQRFSYTNTEFFSLSSTGLNGFSERLGGPVRPSNTVVMDVKADKRTYLRGASYTWYENNSWSQQRLSGVSDIQEAWSALIPYQYENYMDVQEARQGWKYIPVDALFPKANPDDLKLLKNLGSDDLNSILFPTSSLEIRYRNMTTRSIFVPLLSVMPIHDGNGFELPLSEKPHGILIADNKLQNGAKYKVDYVQPMYGDPMFKQALTFSSNDLYQKALDELNNERNAMLRKDPELSYFYKSAVAVEHSSNSNKAEEISKLLKSYGVSESDYNRVKELDKDIEALNQLNLWANNLESFYTSVSNTIPERVRNLSLYITENCRNNYEKALAIRKYLSDNYTYTLNASRVPQGEDFIDWFLFGDKKGYCTYYATAMTIMLRYNNIPARYVEGYVMPEEHNENSVYTITNRYAHAWVEAYFEGFGWLTFEPTPVYSGVVDYKAQIEDATGVIDSGMSSYEEMMERFRNRSDIPGFSPDFNSASHKFKLSDYFKYIPIVLAGLAILLVLINLVASAISNLMLLRMKNRKKIIRYYQTMLKWLESSGYALKPGETVLEFAGRIERDYYFENHNFIAATEIFSKVRYGGKDVSADETAIVKSAFRRLKKCVLKELGIRRYIPLRRIILHI